MRLKTSAQIVAVAAVLGACAAPAANRAPSAAPGLPAAAPADGTPAEQSAPAPANGESPAASSASSAPATAGPGASAAPAPPGVAPASNERHGPPLPELSVKSFGLHIGGGSKDAGARDDFLRALEAHSWRYLDCYRLVEQPGAVGTFGADLAIGEAGGKAKVKTTRTKLRGEAFQTCMVRALESVSFGRPPSGRSVVVSYSVKFSLSE